MCARFFGNRMFEHLGSMYARMCTLKGFLNGKLSTRARFESMVKEKTTVRQERLTKGKIEPRTWKPQGFEDYRRMVDKEKAG